MLEAEKHICKVGPCVRKTCYTSVLHPGETGFSLASVFGIEYLFGIRKRLKYLISSLPNVLIPGSIVCGDFLAPTRKMLQTWKENGFTPASPDLVYDPIMFFAGK